MNTAHIIFIGLLSLLLSTSFVFACADHQPQLETSRSISQGIEGAFIDVHSGNDDGAFNGSATLRVLLNTEQLFSEMTEIEVRLSNPDAIDSDINVFLDMPNSGEVVFDFGGVADFYIGTWRVRIAGVGSNGLTAYETAQVELRAVEDPDAILSSGCDIASRGSTTWASLMCGLLLGCTGLRRRRS